MIKVDTARMREIASQLRSKNSEVGNQLAGLVSTQNTLNGEWEGPSRTVFNEAFHKNVSQFEAFHALLDDYIKALESYAEQYEEMERRNEEIAGTSL